MPRSPFGRTITSRDTERPSIAVTGTCHPARPRIMCCSWIETRFLGSSVAAAVEISMYPPKAVVLSAITKVSATDHETRAKLPLPVEDDNLAFKV